MVKKIEKILKPLINEAGYEMADVKILKQKGDMILEVSIDKDTGIDIDDCVKVTKLINPVLDQHDLIKESYTLEVMSKGVEDGQ